MLLLFKGTTFYACTMVFNIVSFSYYSHLHGDNQEVSAQFNFDPKE